MDAKPITVTTPASLTKLRERRRATRDRLDEQFAGKAKRRECLVYESPSGVLGVFDVDTGERLGVVWPDSE